MNGVSEWDFSNLKAWSKALRKLALRSNHRMGLVVSGDETWCLDVANKILLAADIRDVCWVTETEPLPRGAMPAAKVRTLLGQDTSAVVFNAWSRFDPDAFAAVSGTLSGGGLLLLLTPPFSDWPGFPDPDNARVTVYPFPATQISGRYLRRLVRIICESNDVLSIEQGGKLPVFNSLALARISHQFSTATAQCGALTVVRSVGLLDVVSTTPARPSVTNTRRLSENREPTAEKPFWPDFPIKFVKYTQYSPHLIEKSDSKWLPLATASILGQAPSHHTTLSGLATRPAEKCGPGVQEPDQCVQECRTEDQRTAVASIEKVALGRRRRPLVITSDRGRGKTSSLGIAAAHLLMKGVKKIIITAPRYAVAELVFERIKQLLPEAKSSRGLLTYRDRKINFMPPDELCLQLPQADLVCVDEAASIPAAVLEKLLRRYARIVFASTVHGYEGSGQGFAVRFADILSKRTPGWKSLHMKTPIRWAGDDPLERFVSRAMLLDATLADYFPAAEYSAANVIVERLERDLLASDEKMLTSLFGLLVQAHYQTSPIDLRQLLDGANISLYAIREAGHVIATALVALEGGLDEGISEQILAGRRRPQGHLLPQTLMVQGGFPQAACLSCLRILRVAVNPLFQRHGLGTALLRAVIEEAGNKNIDYVGASFSVLPGRMNFWRSCGFEPVQVGMTRNVASAAHTVVVLRGGSTDGRQLHDTARTRFLKTLPHWLSDPLRNLEIDIALELLQQSGPILQPELTHRDCRSLQAFAEGLGGYEVNILPLWSIVGASLSHADVVSLLTRKEAKVLIAKVIQKHNWSAVADQTGLRGRTVVMATLREAIKKIITSYQDQGLWN